MLDDKRVDIFLGKCVHRNSCPVSSRSWPWVAGAQYIALVGLGGDCSLPITNLLQLNISHMPLPLDIVVLLSHIFEHIPHLLPMVDTCVSNMHSRKCVTLLKLRAELKTFFFISGTNFFGQI